MAYDRGMRSRFAPVLFVIACHAPAPAGSTPVEPQAAPASEAEAPAFPEAGAVAPEFALRTADGATVTLAQARADGPVVIVFGSFT
jgi:hypothetical protein